MTNRTRRNRASSGAVIAAAVVALGVGWWFASDDDPVGRAVAPGSTAPRSADQQSTDSRQALSPEPPPISSPESAPANARPAELSAAEKSARVAQIKRDYDEIGKRFANEFAAAGKDFPGGLSAYLRQLALMEREKWKDIAAVLSPAELEDLQMIDLRAGQLVQQWLGDSPASEAQRRAVFRLQKEFDDRFALTFDTSPPALYEREAQRHAMLVAVAGVLGETALFPTWMRSDGGDYAKATAFVAERGLPPATAFELWGIRHEYTAGRLKILTQPGLSPEQIRAAQSELAAQIRARLQGVLGAEHMQAGADVLNWLPAN